MEMTQDNIKGMHIYAYVSDVFVLSRERDEFQNKRIIL